MLSGKRIALGVTGGIAAYRAAELISLLKKEGAEVRAVMTEHACQFIAPMTLATLSGNPVHTDLFARATRSRTSRWPSGPTCSWSRPPRPTRWPSSPSASPTISQHHVSGHALPVLLAPAMNAAMWKHPATQQNAERLRAWGRALLRPRPRAPRLRRRGRGPHGRAAGHPARHRRNLCKKQDFAGRRVLVTAGPHARDARPRALLTNRSTGKMGFAIAEGRARPRRAGDARLWPRLPACARGRGVCAHRFLRRIVRGGAFPRGEERCGHSGRRPGGFPSPRRSRGEDQKKRRGHGAGT